MLHLYSFIPIVLTLIEVADALVGLLGHQSNNFVLSNQELVEALGHGDKIPAWEK
jgi:hypothetical protein